MYSFFCTLFSLGKINYELIKIMGIIILRLNSRSSFLSYAFLCKFSGCLEMSKKNYHLINS